MPEALRTSLAAAKQDLLHIFTEEQAENLYDNLFWDNVKKEKIAKHYDWIKHNPTEFINVYSKLSQIGKSTFNLLLEIDNPELIHLLTT